MQAMAIVALPVTPKIPSRSQVAGLVSFDVLNTKLNPYFLGLQAPCHKRSSVYS